MNKQKMCRTKGRKKEKKRQEHQEYINVCVRLCVEKLTTSQPASQPETIYTHNQTKPIIRTTSSSPLFISLLPPEYLASILSGNSLKKEKLHARTHIAYKMERLEKLLTAGRPEYENFEPKTKVIDLGAIELLLIYLPGFKQSQLRLELTPNRLFKVSGERQVANNKWSRVAKEYPASENGDLSRVTAEFQTDALVITQPKLIAKVVDKEKPAEAESNSPAPPKSAEKPANVEAQAQPMQKEDGSKNYGRVIPVVDIPPISMQKYGIELPERHPKNLDAKLIAKEADKAKPAGAESTSPATSKSAEKPAHVEARAQPKQKKEVLEMTGYAIELPERHPKNLDAKLIVKVADKAKPTGAESTSPATSKSAEKPAHVDAQAQAQAQAQPKQKEEGSNNNGRAKPLEDRPLKQKEESKMAAAQKETDEKMKGTVAEDDGAVVGKARKPSDDQKHRNGNGNSLARIGEWTKTLVTMIGSKPRMVVNIVLVVVVGLLLGLYITSSPMPAKSQQ
ncbi:protein RESTRICTED TEV MOVEMENT 2-like [Diospyros lotus]|uniref:protein RESTRICTED TEV MOVEMENT 2-like n=1 Tax=Diospyros lotus TaxID=55363 RepID=UPI002254E1F1|nr:protein RESTRICTED TEV MOVEMENT 2-like [Diospyros lotus]